MPGPQRAGTAAQYNSVQKHGQRATCLKAISQNNPGTPVPEVFIVEIIGAKDGGVGGDNWSCKRCKAPVKSSPNKLNTDINKQMKHKWWTEYFTQLKYTDWLSNPIKFKIFIFTAPRTTFRYRQTEIQKIL